MRGCRDAGGTGGLVFLLLCWASLTNGQPLGAATPADTVVENRAEASGRFSSGTRFSARSNVDRFTVEGLSSRTAATVELLRYDPLGRSTPTVIRPTGFQAADGTWQPILSSGSSVLRSPTVRS